MNTISSVEKSIKSFTGSLRESSFLSLVDIVKHRTKMTIIETGTIRYPDVKDFDGASTLTLAKLADATASDFYSVDIDKDHIDISRKALGENSRFVVYKCCDSVPFLSSFDSKIDVLYLDSYDYSKDNPLPSQIHHAAEIGAAYGKLSPKAVVLIDDCNIEGGGKGLFVDMFLKERGWKLVVDEYQKLFVR